MKQFFKNKVSGLLLSLFSILPLYASAGGITLGGTRIIYAQDSRQTAISVRNTDNKSTFLVQSWVEHSNGQKTRDFVVTPPLFTSGPGNENMLRLVYSGADLPRDKESLYFFNTKAIPSVDKSALEGKNALILAAITRVKLFVRPANLKPSPDAAPAALRFSHAGSTLAINNPTPYYLTLTDLKAGKTTLQDTMVAPMSQTSVPLPVGAGGDITFSTINDYGGVTQPQNGVLN